MDDLIAASATIQGAQIQANYTLWAAAIGGLFLLASILITAKATLNAHKADKLAEAKRDVYLNLVRKWQNYLMAANSFRNFEKRKDFNENYSLALTELIAALHEASFISNPLTKEKLFDFTMQFTLDLSKINDCFDEWYVPEDNGNRLKIIINLMDILKIYGLKALDLQKELRKEMGLPEDEMVNQRIMKKQEKFAEKIKSKLLGKSNID